MFTRRRTSEAPRPGTTSSTSTDDLSASTFHPVSVWREDAFQGPASQESNVVSEFRQDTAMKIVQTGARNAAVSINPDIQTVTITSTPSDNCDTDAGQVLYEASFRDVKAWHGDRGLLYVTAMSDAGTAKKGNFLFQARTVNEGDFRPGKPQVWFELCPE